MKDRQSWRKFKKYSNSYFSDERRLGEIQLEDAASVADAVRDSLEEIRQDEETS